MTNAKRRTPEEIIKSFTDEFKTKIKDIRIEKRTHGAKKTEFVTIWFTVDNSVFKRAVKHLIGLDPKFPHLAVASGNDLGKTIQLLYHFSLYHGTRNEEISVNMLVDLPKTNPTIETLSDIIPGAVITEREKQEMLGVKVKGIPDNRRLFLPDDFPKGVYPWRKDETGPQKMVRNLHEVKP